MPREPTNTTMQKVEAQLMPMCSLPQADADLYVEWMRSQAERTRLDPGVVGYPRACMAKAAYGGKTVALVPVHPVCMVESLGVDDSLNNSEKAVALCRIQQKLVEAMRDSGIGEAFFETSDSHFADIAEKNGWEKKLYDPEKKTFLMRLKIPKIAIPEPLQELYARLEKTKPGSKESRAISEKIVEAIG